MSMVREGSTAAQRGVVDGVVLGRDYGGGAGPSEAFYIPDKPFQVQSVRNLTKGTYVLKLDRHGMKFRPGQCVSVGLHKSGVNREYSIYSGTEDPFLEVLIREVEGGSVSPALRRSGAGTVLDVLGPYSEFVLQAPEDTARKYLFIGTGTGIAPYRAFTRSYNLDYMILHGVSYDDERYDHEEYAAGRYFACISREKVDGSYHGRVTEYLRTQSLDSSLYCYLCGNRKMIDEVYDILRAKGISSTNIITEVFF